MHAATIQKAACEGSPGTSKSSGRSREGQTVTAPGSPLQPGTAQRQQLLGVGPGWNRFSHGGGAVRGQSGQQDRALHLGARHRWLVVDAPQTAAPHHQRRQPAPFAAVDRRAHGPEGLGHPVHRAPGDRLVTGQHGEPVDGGGPAGQQADAGARVAHVDRGARLRQPAGATLDHHLAGGAPTDGGAKLAHRLEGVPDVLAGRQAPEHRPALGAGRQEEHPVGDRLVAGHPNPPMQTAGGGPGNERARRHQGPRPCFPAAGHGPSRRTEHR